MHEGQQGDHQHHHAADGEGDRIGCAARPVEPGPGKLKHCEIEQIIGEIGKKADYPMLNLPANITFKIGVKFEIR